jgi:predicted enzyme related to lactoylglutathione lyase
MFHPRFPGARFLAAALLAAAALGSGPSGLAGSAPKLPPLTTVSGNPRLPGKFVWADLVTDNLPAAQKFYTQLFQWEFYSYGNYLIAFNDGRPLCGAFQRPKPAGSKAAPRWFGYISVSDVRKAQQAVLQAGGRVLAEPANHPKRGEQAVFADAEGAVFGVVRSGTGDPEDWRAEPGDWVWVQLLSRDARRAAEFYRSVAGYEVVENSRPQRQSDFVLTSRGFARATVRTLPQDKPDVQPHWLPFVRVKAISESVALAKQLGGRVVVEPRPDLLDGKVAVVADPTGAAIGILEWHEALMKGGQ